MEAIEPGPSSKNPVINVPSFLNKLWNMINDPANNHLIHWSKNGASFIIANRIQFTTDILPAYYKHKNLSSFIRQLNMYDFHKVSSIEPSQLDDPTNSLASSTQVNTDEMHFAHPYFLRHQPQLLSHIKRKMSTGSKQSTPTNFNTINELVKCLRDVHNLGRRQSSITNQLFALRQENSLLWREVFDLRHEHKKQKNVVYKLLQFLLSLIRPRKRIHSPIKRQLMLDQYPTKDNNSLGLGEGSSSTPAKILRLDNMEHSATISNENQSTTENNDNCLTPTTTNAIVSSPVDDNTAILPSDYNAKGFPEELVQLADSSDDYNDLPCAIQIGQSGELHFENTEQQQIFVTPPKTSPSTSTSTKTTTLSQNTISAATVPNCNDEINYDTDILSSHIETTDSQLDLYRDLLQTLDCSINANQLMEIFNGESPVGNMDLTNDDLLNAASVGVINDDVLTELLKDYDTSGEFLPYNNMEQQQYESNNNANLLAAPIDSKPIVEFVEHQQQPEEDPTMYRTLNQSKK